MRPNVNGFRCFRGCTLQYNYDSAFMIIKLLNKLPADDALHNALSKLLVVTILRMKCYVVFVF